MNGDRRPLRILHVSEVHWGGVVTLLEHFLEQQVRAGHEAHLLAHPDFPPVDPGATVHRWRVDRHRPSTLPLAQRQLRRLVRDLRPDVVHLHSWFAGALARAPLGISGVPVVYQPHAWSDRLSTRPGAPTVVRLSERFFARQTTLLVTNCEDEIARGRQIGVHKPAHAIGVAVDLARFRPPTDEERDEARQRLGIPADQRLVLVLGRLAWQKGQDQLVAAWVADLPGDTTLALVGPGKVEFVADIAGEELGQSVIAPGSTTDVRPWLWAADVMVLSSRYETVALVVAEAMATGLPVVATSVDGVHEVLCTGPQDPAGTVVPTDRHDVLVRELHRRLDDPSMLDRESVAGPLRAKARFAPESVACLLDAAYREAIHQHRLEHR